MELLHCCEYSVYVKGFLIQYLHIHLLMTGWGVVVTNSNKSAKRGGGSESGGTLGILNQKFWQLECVVHHR